MKGIAVGKPIEIILLSVIVMIGLTARLYEAGYNLDGDEVFRSSWPPAISEVISRSLQDRPHPPLHNVLLYLWIKVFGPSETSTRALSVVFSAGFLWPIVACRFMSTGIALGCFACWR